MTIALAATGLLLLGACASTPAPPVAPLNLPETGSVLRGYLGSKQLPNSLTLLPPPPAAGSAAFAADQQAYESTRKLEGTARWTLATQDADLTFPTAAGTFSCALGIPVTLEATPHLYTLLRRSLTDAGSAPSLAKSHYQRTRPFVAYNAHTCAPADEAGLKVNGSYPSGHTSIGWAWALILAEIAPEQQDRILQRGFAFGQSRVICGAHWQSDVEAGRVIGASVVARLHADPVFQSQLDAARGEVADMRTQGLPPTRDCAAETAALAETAL